MDTQILLKWSAYFLALILMAWPLSRWLVIVAEGQWPRWMSWFGRFEDTLYRWAGVKEASSSDIPSMSWGQYAHALVIFNALGVFIVYLLQRLQSLLPFNPQSMAAVSPDSAFNTAISFVTNTNWQGYAGESTMSYLTQMLALTVQNFLSAATGIAVVFAITRGFMGRSSHSLGNFWVDITRSTLGVLLPLSMLCAILFMGQGVIQTMDAYTTVQTLESVQYTQPKMDAKGQPVLDAKGAPAQETITTRTQSLAMGPVASQEAIKMIGTNGGGFFNANSAHPFENPTPLANWIQMLAIFLIPTALCLSFGQMVGDSRQGWTLLGTMFFIFIAMLSVVTLAEQHNNPKLDALLLAPSAISTHASITPSVNMEGKETRFGITDTTLFAAITTAASCGAVNAMHDSLTPLGGLVPLWLIQLGEVVFGGVGSGLYGMLIMALLAVFIAGLMIGRTPEYLGKKIEAYEMKMVSIAILATPLLVLGGTAIAVLTDAGKAGISNPGAHGFTQALYAFSSAANNNGSAFAGLSANTSFYNTLLAIAMWFGRFSVIIPVLAIAGSLAAKKKLDVTPGTMPTHGALFMGLLISTVVIVGALTYVPALALGPVVEHLQLFSTGK